MKSTLVILSLLLGGLFAQAGNEGAQAVPALPYHVLAEYRMNGGFFVPNDMPVARHYKILSNGFAIVEVFYRNSSGPKPRVLKKLTSGSVQNVYRLLSQIQPGALYNPQPNSPQCQDAPSYSYIAHTPVYGDIKIGETSGCITKSRRNANSADKELKHMLDEIAKLDKVR